MFLRLTAASGQPLYLQLMQQIRHAADLHDVGKVAIPDAILDKPGPLDDEEWTVMRRHTIVGERIVAAAPALRDVARLVRASHERYDGAGYPDGRAGEDIPLGARIVAVSSIGHLFSPVVFDDLDYRYRPYDPWTSYGQSKTAAIHFAVAAAERWAHDGITANALMPGNIADTGLARNIDMRDVVAMMDAGELTLPPGKTVQQGAATSTLLAASPTVEGVTGQYYEDCAPSEPIAQRADATRGVAPYALDPENAARLWTVSEALTR